MIEKKSNYNNLVPVILGNIDASDAPPALQQILKAVDSTTILAITDDKGTILYVNDLFCEISKYSREELIGQNHRVVKSDYHSKSFFIEMWQIIKSGKTWQAEIKNTAKDGSAYWVDTSIVPFLDDNGKPYRFAAIRKDITDKKKLSAQIEAERANSLNSEKMAALGEMAAGIAHEVGNPLAAMRGRAELMKMKAESKGFSAEDAIKTADTIVNLIDRTSKIIKGLRSYARDASNDIMENIDICQLANDILDLSKPRIEKLKIKLVVEIDSKSIRASCREAEISQVLVNLVNNACDVLNGKSNRRIIVRIFSSENDAVIEVEDSGGGIPSDVRMKIFQPFFTTKEPGKGTGLGLSIARKIMASHNGTLRLKEIKNTCFEMRWPTSDI